jgi:hypothetical protein
MGFCSRVVSFSNLVRIGMLVSLAAVTGCQTTSPATVDRMAAHAANIDLSGLSAGSSLLALNVRAAVPHGWKAMAVDSCALYTHEQWRSPSHTTGVGVAYIHMPLPMSAKTLVWLARTQYSAKTAKEHTPDAQLLGEWTDSLGREWFEGENNKYHIKGYVITNGMEAWVVYSGYRIHSPPGNREINLAFRSMDSIMPLPLAQLASGQ